MAKRQKYPTRTKLLKELIAELQPTSMAELQEALRDLFAETIETMLKGELDANLGYEKHDQKPKATENRRNGSYEKKVRSNLGELTISVPRDRNGEFEPQLVPNGTKDVSGIEDKVMSMYAKGLSDRDISDTIAEIYGFSLSHETISRIIDRIHPKLIEWQTRQLCEVYPFIYIDAMVTHVKQDGKAMNKAVYSVIGINADGYKDCLGFWISENEGSHFW